MSWFDDVGDALTGVNAGMQDTGKTFQTFNSVVAGQQINDLNALNLRNQSMLQDAHEGNGANDYYNLLGYQVPVAQAGLARDTANNQDDQTTAAMGARQGMRSQDFTQGGKYAVGSPEYNGAVNDYLSQRDPTIALQTYGALGIPGLQRQEQQNDLAVQYLNENMNNPKTKSALGIDPDTDIDVVRLKDGSLMAMGKDGEEVPIPNSYQIAAQTLEQAKGTAAGFNALTGEGKGLLALQGGGYGQGAAGTTGATPKAAAKVPNDDELKLMTDAVEKAQKNYTDIIKATSGMSPEERAQYMQEASKQRDMAQANYNEAVKRRRAANSGNGAASGTFGPGGQFKARDALAGAFGLPSQGGLDNNGAYGRPRNLGGRTADAGAALALGQQPNPGAGPGLGFGAPGASDDFSWLMNPPPDIGANPMDTAQVAGAPAPAVPQAFGGVGGSSAAGDEVIGQHIDQLRNEISVLSRGGATGMRSPTRGPTMALLAAKKQELQQLMLQYQQSFGGMPAAFGLYPRG